MVKHEKHNYDEVSVVRQSIFGISDGVVSTVALVASLTAAGVVNTIILIAAMAEIFAGAISMGLGAYISTKTDAEANKRAIDKEKLVMLMHPQICKKELLKIYKKKGIKGKELRDLVGKLMKNKKVCFDTIMTEHLGIREESIENPRIAGVAMGISYVISGFIPAVPFFFLEPIRALYLALVLSVAVVFMAGVGRARYTGRGWFKSAIELVMITALATASAYYIGSLFRI
jgi:vacuolar iron transporter family protein